LYTNPCDVGRYSTIEECEEDDQFKKNFKLIPSRFLLIEASLEKRCFRRL
jgi:hypothetical protein